MAMRASAKSKDYSNVQVPPESLLALLDCIKKCNKTPELSASIEVVINETCALLGCDRATLFMVDDVREQLVIKTAVGVKDIRIPWNVGIVGHVFQTGELDNIPDAYADSRFSQDTDKKTGYHTHSILCLPVRDADDNIVAVLEAINKKIDGSNEFGAFSEQDEMICSHLSGQLGIILRNALLYEQSVTEKAKVRAMLDIAKSLHNDMGMNSLMFTITERTPALADADRCTMYLVDAKHKELWSMHGAVEIRIPWDVGLAGAVVQDKGTVNIVDAYEDSRFDQEFDKKSGYRTKSVLCMPIHNRSGDIIGVIQLINKLHGGHFDEYDEQILNSFLDIAGGILENSQLFHHQKTKMSEMEKVLNVSSAAKHVAPVGLQGAIIEEGDEEEEEDDDE